MEKKIVNQVQEALQRVPYRINPRRNTPRYTTFMAESEEELNSLLIKVKEENEKLA